MWPNPHSPLISPLPGLPDLEASIYEEYVGPSCGCPVTWAWFCGEFSTWGYGRWGVVVRALCLQPEGPVQAGQGAGRLDLV